MSAVLIIGGAGVFGRRLGEGLARCGHDVMIAGRDAARAKAVADELRRAFPDVGITTYVIDSAIITPDDIAHCGAAVAVDAAGPFQGAPARVAEAAIAAGVGYVDLADARDFVAGFARLDAAAKAAGAVALTGASSTPALSNAAVDHLTTGWRRIDTIDVAIAPGNRTPRGPSVVAAILSWVGRPVTVFEAGRWRERPGWTGTRLTMIDGLGRRRVALAETPDLDLLARRHGARWRARFDAGLEIRVLHYGLVLLARLRRLGAIRDPARLAGAVRRLADLLVGLGTDRGGMVVAVAGRDRDDSPCFARWSLVAEAGSGPHVPTFAALAAIRKTIAGKIAPGARACVGVVDLDEIVAEMAPHPISTQMRKEPAASVFERALGADFGALPAAIREAHAGGPVTRLAGRARVDGAASLLGRVIGWAIGFPPAGEDVEVEVVMEVEPGGREVWRRRFGRDRFASILTATVPGRYAERFGIVTVDLDIEGGTRGLDIGVRGWRIGPLPLPRRLAPKSVASERVDADGRFAFDIDLALLFLGRVVRYRGWLAPVEAAREIALHNVTR